MKQGTTHNPEERRKQNTTQKGNGDADVRIFIVTEHIYDIVTVIACQGISYDKCNYNERVDGLSSRVKH